MARDATTYPTPSDYQEALQFPATAFSDPLLAAGTPATNALGLPQPITGAFAVVFPVETAEGRVAVRCFLTPVADGRQRYRAVAEHLAAADLPYTTDFEYRPRGIRVGGAAYPILTMAWVEGEGLAAFVERHRSDPATLRALAEAWRTMLADLAAAGIAHGDLQHGNVLVQHEPDALRLRLVDYDTVFVPALKGHPSTEVGHRNYQHPDRTEDDFDPALDRFAGLVVYTALRALAEQPSLWARYSTGENLLFQAGDFYDPAASPLFEELRRIEPVRPLAEALATACYLEPSGVPPLERVLAGEMAGPRPALRRGRARQRDSRPARRSRAEAVFLPTAVGMIVGVAVLRLAGFGGFALVSAVIATIILVAVGERAYRGTSLVRRRHRLDREAAVLERWIAELEDERTRLRTERRRFVDDLGAFRAARLQELRDEALERRLRHHFINELDAVEEVGHRAVVRMKAVGIRNAFHATPERVAEARGISSESRARIGRWRESLAALYADAVPETLSTAEEQRLRRQVERRLAGLDDELVRVAAKAEVQRGELAKLVAQREAVPALGRWRYLLYLLRVRPLPSLARPASAPILQRPAAERQPPEPAPSATVSTDGAWWEQA